MTERPLVMIKRLFSSVDPGTGRLSIIIFKYLLTCAADSDFLKILEGKLNFRGYERDIKALFKRIDLEKRGYITVEEFAGVVFNLPGCLANTTIGTVREVLAKRYK